VANSGAVYSRLECGVNLRRRILLHAGHAMTLDAAEFIGRLSDALHDRSDRPGR
jgi:hypothetical protein